MCSRVPLLDVTCQCLCDMISNLSQLAKTVGSQGALSIATPASTASAPDVCPRYTRPAGFQHTEKALAAPSTFDPSFPGRDRHAGGVDLMVADAGVHLWFLARNQAGSGAGNHTALRSAHVDALRYMCFALPNDLSSSEIEIIRASLPVQVQQCDQAGLNSGRIAGSNLLRRGVTRAVCWLVALALVLVPLMLTALNKFLDLEREHQILRRVLKTGAQLTSRIRGQCMEYVNAVLRHRDSTLARLSLAIVFWVVDGLAGGLIDGLVESANAHLVLIEQHNQPK